MDDSIEINCKQNSGEEKNNRERLLNEHFDRHQKCVCLQRETQFKTI